MGFKLSKDEEAKLPYTVKVGDICYALVGQIVGRTLLPVRYQPTGGLVINSPVAKPELAAKVRKDWTGLTAADFLNQLIQDANAEGSSNREEAVRRLRYYFPSDYVLNPDGTVKPVSGHSANIGK